MIKKEKKSALIIIVTLTCLIVIGTCIYLIYNSTQIKNNDLNQKEEHINVDIEKEDNNQEEIILNLKPFDSNKYNNFEKKILNALSNSEEFNKEYYNNWNFEDIEYINLDNITYYGQINDEYIYKLEFKYKCKTNNDICVFLSSQVGGDYQVPIEISKSIFIYIKDKRITQIESEHGGSGPIIYEYNNKLNLIDTNKLFVDYVRSKYPKYNLIDIQRIEKTEYLYAAVSPNTTYKYFYKIFGKIDDKRLDLIMIIEIIDSNEINLLYLDKLDKKDSL